MDSILYAIFVYYIFVEDIYSWTMYYRQCRFAARQFR